jgi:hypothetical protein
VQESAPPPRPAELAPDRERDAGFRGDALVRASLLFGLVFVVGFAIVGMILWSRRKPAAQRPQRP